MRQCTNPKDDKEREANVKYTAKFKVPPNTLVHGTVTFTFKHEDKQCKVNQEFPVPVSYTTPPKKK